MYIFGMHITMVKKRLKDGSACRKCEEAAAHLRTRGLLERIDEVVWADEDDPASAGAILGERHGVERAPFFVIREGNDERVVTSVLRLVQQLEKNVSDRDRARMVDPDDVGGI